MTLEAKVQDFLAQKRIAVAGLSRDNSHHPVGNLIEWQIRLACPVMAAMMLLRAGFYGQTHTAHRSTAHAN